MFLRACFVFFSSCLFTSVFAQEKFTVVKDLRGEWTTFEDGTFQPLGKESFTGINTVYFTLEPRAHNGHFLRLQSHRAYYLFVNGKVRGEFEGIVTLRIDSLLQVEQSPAFRLAIHQERINAGDLKTEVISLTPASQRAEMENPIRPYWYFRDFVVMAGLIIIVFFLVVLRLNPKLAAEYFSVGRLLSSRESDEGQASARLTSSSNVQYYVLCSMLIGFYLLIVLYNLPSRYALPIRFRAWGFWTIALQWLKLSAIIFLLLMLKIFLVFSLTRLFGMWGMARYHFFNWIRLLLLVFGAASVVLFVYFIGRGHNAEVFVIFLSMVVVTLSAWSVLAFFKFIGRSGHSMFHLFSYLCATEIIPLLITAKVLFQ
jgi:hypothetical protein